MPPTEQYNPELYHYGVKGMKWGVRKSEYKTMSKQQKKKTRDDYRSDEKWKRKTLTSRNYWKAFDKARREFDSEAINVVVNRKDKTGKNLTDQYVKKWESNYRARFNEILGQSIASVVKSPTSESGRYTVDMVIASKELDDMPYMTLVDNFRDEVMFLNVGR